MIAQRSRELRGLTAGPLATGGPIGLAFLLMTASVGFGQTSGADPHASGAAADRFITQARQLTFEGKRNGEAYYSPDGTQLVFSGERETGNPFFQIYVLDLKTGDTTRASPGIGKTTCAFFQTGTGRVLFASTHLDPECSAKQTAEYQRRESQGESRYAGWDYDPWYEIFSANPDGSDLKRLTNAQGYDAEAAYSPDGKLIVLSSMREAYPPEKLSADDQTRLQKTPEYFLEIYVMNADGSEPRRLTEWPGYDGGPFFSPDGKRIIWRHFEENGMIADVYTMNIDGTDRKRLTEFDSMSWAPFYHPSSKYVIFSSNKEGFENFELYVVDVEGTKQPVRVTQTPKFDGLPVFDPSGKRICWTSTRTADGASQLFVGDWDHQAVLKALDESPAR